MALSLPCCGCVPSRHRHRRLTTLEGYSYLIDEKDGLHSVTDPNGNSLTVTADGLSWTNAATSGSSLSVAFLRDRWGLITNIVDTAGHAMQYQYDWNDDLVAFIDREGHTNTFWIRRTVR